MDRTNLLLEAVLDEAGTGDQQAALLATLDNKQQQGQDQASLALELGKEHRLCSQ